jgi:hypothetical protein
MGDAMLGARFCGILVPEMLSERRLTLREGFDGFDGAATATVGAGAVEVEVVSSGCGIAGGMSAGAVPSSSRSGPANTIKDAELDDEARLRGAGGPLLRLTPACWGVGLCAVVVRVVVEGLDIMFKERGGPKNARDQPR